jgi:hypothetical protein
VLGPLPPLHRVVVSVVVIGLFIALGAWSAFMLPVEVVAGVGVAAGAAVGGLALYVLVHDFQSQPVRFRHRR